MLNNGTWRRVGALLLLTCCFGQAAEPLAAATQDFPRPLSEYPAMPDASLWQVLTERARAEPFNVVATGIFFLAVIHTFMTPLFLRWAHEAEANHGRRLASNATAAPDGKEEVSLKAEVLHFFGEVEAIFGIWVIPLLISFAAAKGWGQAKAYMNHGVHFTEPMFVVVIMAIAASRPILKLAERLMAGIASIAGGGPGAWWVAILTLGPLLGSFITEPAAMTICALLLGEKIYERKPSAVLAYATLGLLFVNISVGGTLTHFAAPPVLMVANKWDWGTSHMLAHFGWKAVLGIIAANACYYAYFRRELRALHAPEPPLDLEMAQRRELEEEPVPLWITFVHLLFLGWTVLNSHYPVLFIGGFLFYLAFTQATQHHQFDLQLRPPLLVGFFLAGLVVHGGLQGWWIEPVLSRLAEVPLFFGAVGLTAFNDNAAITYLASLVPDFSAELKYAVVAGAVAGGGLTVIANAPNPAGQSILSPYFRDGISPVYLLLGALLPTAMVVLCFLLFR